jgi:predicted nucleotide-binding protein (sugar kinase/HSP70/actin superfamily)
MPGADGPCRFGQYSMLQRLVLNRIGQGEVAILSPSSENAYMGLSQKLRMGLWQAMLISDMLLKAVCKVRPYEIEKGAVDQVLEEEIQRLAHLTEEGRDVRLATRKAIARIAAIPTEGMGSRPLVGIVGEIYVRCNPFSNDYLIRSIEQYGGEAWLSPMSEWVLYTAVHQRWRAQRRPFHIGPRLVAWLKNKRIFDREHEFVERGMPLLEDRREPPVEQVIDEGSRMMPMNFSGEAILTLGRARIFVHQRVALVVNVAPFSCMPGTITAALCRQVQAETNVPMASLFYDGEGGMNQLLAVFLAGLMPEAHGELQRHPVAAGLEA